MLLFTYKVIHWIRIYPTNSAVHQLGPESTCVLYINILVVLFGVEFAENCGTITSLHVLYEIDCSIASPTTVPQFHANINSKTADIYNPGQNDWDYWLNIDLNMKISI